MTTIDFERFHTVDLPTALAARDNGVIASDSVGVGRAVAFRIPDGNAFTYRAVAGRTVIEPGADAPVVVELDRDNATLGRHRTCVRAARSEHRRVARDRRHGARR